MCSGTGCCSYSVVWRIGWSKYLVDDMDYTIAGADICNRDCGIVNHDRVANCECKWLTVYGSCATTFCNIGSRYCTSYYVIQKDVSQGFLAFWGVQRCEIDSCISKRLVSRCEDCERTLSLQCLYKFCLRQCCN